MSDFTNTVGFKRLSESTLPDLVRKLDKVSKMDVDGLIKAVNRMAQAQEEANRIAKREMRLKFNSVEQAEDLEKPKPLSEGVLVLHDAIADRLKTEKKFYISGVDRVRFLSSPSSFDDLPMGYSICGEYISIWEVGISEKDACIFVEDMIARTGNGSYRVIGKDYDIIHDNDKVHSMLLSRGINVEMIDMSESEKVAILTKRGVQSDNPTFYEDWDKPVANDMSDEDVESFVLGIVGRIKNTQDHEIVLKDEAHLRVFQRYAVRDRLLSKRCDFCYKRDGLHVFDYSV